MHAVFYTADILDWSQELGAVPWPLLPVANRPLLDYWLEFCAEQKVDHVQVILGEGAEKVEQFAGDGSRWGLSIQYSFARSGEKPLDYLKATRDRWDDGLLFFGGPLHLRRRKAYQTVGFKALQHCRYDHDGAPVFLCGRTGGDVASLLEASTAADTDLEKVHIHPFFIDGLASFFDLNMKMVMGEHSRYVSAGFSENDGTSVGHNVLTPPSSHLQSPVIIGNACRFGAMTTIGPKAVVGDHVIVDSHTELSNCMILQDTYIGKNLEIRNKIVSGNRLIDPSDGTVVEIDDSWIVAQNRPDMRTEDLFRYIVLWFMALGLFALQLIPFVVLYPLVWLLRAGRFERLLFHDPRRGYIRLPVFKQLRKKRGVLIRIFRALVLDRFPLLTLALRGRIFVCGQPPMQHPEDDEIIKELPHYYPAVFSYEDYNMESDRLVDSLWYAHIRSLFEDVKILIKSCLNRFFRPGNHQD